MKTIAPGIALLFVLSACGHKKPPESAENYDQSSEEPSKESTNESSKSSAEPDPVASEPSSSNALGGSGIGNTTAAEKATVRDELDKVASPCEGMNIPNLFASLSQAACEVPANAPAAKQRATKDVLEVVITPDSPKTPPGSTAQISVIFKNKGKTKLPLDFTVDPDPRFTFELYTPKGARVDKPAGKEPPLPAQVSDTPPVDASRTARVTLYPKGTAKLVLPWDAVRYKWASKEKAKGALPGRGYPREPAGPLPNGKYVLRVITPLANVDDQEIRQPKLTIEIGGTPPPPPATPKKEPAPEATAAPAASSSESVESKFLKTVGATPPATPPAASTHPPAKKH
jgi:hypothetical protein